MIGSMIGAGLSAIGGIAGGIKNAKAARKARKLLRQYRGENAAWYNRNYNEEALHRADAQRAVNQAREMLENRNKAVAGRQAVMGGTNESLAQAQDASNAAVADTMSNINAQAEARKAQVQQQYRDREDQLNQKQIQMEEQRSRNIAGAVKDVAATGSQIAGAMGEVNVTPSPEKQAKGAIAKLFKQSFDNGDYDAYD